MATELYDALLEKLPEIAEAVKVFDNPGAQERAVDALIRSLGVTRAEQDRSSEASGLGNGEGGQTGGGDRGTGSGEPSGGLERLANALGVPGDRIELVYLEDGDGLQVAANPDALGSTNKARAATVALLVAGGRQLGGWDQGSTGDADIRAEVDRLGLYDQGNYAKHMKGATPWLNINGVGTGATFKLKHPGRQHLTQMVRDLTQTN
jgi:hypothetical protein